MKANYTVQNNEPYETATVTYEISGDRELCWLINSLVHNALLRCGEEVECQGKSQDFLPTRHMYEEHCAARRNKDSREDGPETAAPHAGNRILLTMDGKNAKNYAKICFGTFYCVLHVSKTDELINGMPKYVVTPMARFEQEEGVVSYMEMFQDTDIGRHMVACRKFTTNGYLTARSRRHIAEPIMHLARPDVGGLFYVPFMLDKSDPDVVHNTYNCIAL